MMTSREVTEEYWPTLPTWQHRANEAYIDLVWQSLTMGGIWACPVALTLFTKVEDGWEVVTDA